MFLLKTILCYEELYTDARDDNTVLLTKINTPPEKLNSILYNELQEISDTTKKRITDSLKKNYDYDSTKFKDVIYLKKKIIDHGDHEIINIKLREELIPINEEEQMRDFGLKAIFGGILFLGAGILLTIGLKMYHEFVKTQIFNKIEINENK